MRKWFCPVPGYTNKAFADLRDRIRQEGILAALSGRGRVELVSAILDGKMHQKEAFYLTTEVGSRNLYVVCHVGGFDDDVANNLYTIGVCSTASGAEMPDALSGLYGIKMNFDYYFREED